MAFVFSKTTPATGGFALFDLKTLLKLVGWTVLSSSDGTTYFPASDGITTGAAGAGGMNNSRAWFRIQSPTGGRQFTVQRSVGGATSWRIVYSPALGFIIGAPSATQVPSAADAMIMLGSGTDAAPVFSGPWLGADGTYRYNAMAENVSPYRFWVGAFPIGGGAPNSSWVYDSLLSTVPTDGNVQAIYIAQTGAPPLVSVSLSSPTNVNGPIWCTPAAVVPALTWVPFGALLLSNDAGLNVAPNFMGTNPLSTKDEVVPILLARRSSLSNGGYKGIFSLMKWTGTARTTGDTLTVTTPRDRIVYGDISFDWDGTVPVV